MVNAFGQILTGDIISDLHAVEAYPSGKGELIKKLNKLAVTDKHRWVLGVVGHGGKVDLGDSMREAMQRDTDREIPEFSFWMASRDKTLSLTPGEVFYSAPADNKREVKKPFAFGMAFEINGVTDSAQAAFTLTEIWNKVNETVRRFERHFP